MGLRGPPPKPAEELKLRGTFRADRHADRDKVPKAEGTPKKPRHLKGEAAAHWRDVVPLLAGNGTAKQADTAALVALCETWALYRTCMELAEGDPALAVDKDWRIARNAYLAQWAALAAKCGLTPADRMRLRVGEAEKKPEGVSGFARKRA